MPLGPIQCARDTRERRVVAMAEGGGGLKLEQTQTWIIAFICSVIVASSDERILHLLGKALKKKKKQKALFEKSVDAAGFHLAAAGGVYTEDLYT